ncbi:MAG TPA: DNA-binding protein [Candidatus Moranbacteria bacterium]|nr:DNA-binding protein [Candidatus Moranbacteria bacterium]
MPDEIIENKIFLIRGKKVMFDKDLAVLYGVETRTLNQAVRRNIDRFPEDFMFQLTKIEIENFSRSQIVILKRGQNIKYNPYVFTEQGVAMLSSVLKSKRAIQVNIQIMRTFTKIREMIISNKELRLKIEAMERKYDNKFQSVFDAIKRILITQVKEKPERKRKIGFRS